MSVALNLLVCLFKVKLLTDKLIAGNTHTSGEADEFPGTIDASSRLPGHMTSGSQKDVGHSDIFSTKIAA